MLRVGQDIRPPTSPSDAVRLAQLRYGLDVAEVVPMISYDDRNYRLELRESPQTYTLKVSNTLDSANPRMLDALAEVQELLWSRGVPVPRLVRDLEGRLWSHVDLGGEKYAVRLQTYLPGLPLGQIPFSTELLKNWGEALANIHLKLKDYRNDFLDSRDHTWRLENVTKLSDFLSSAVPQPGRRALVTRIVGDFERVVLPQLPRLEHGLLHGDFNENNVLADDNSRVVGVLDLGDMYRGPLVLDVAVMLTYTLLKPGDPAPLCRAPPCLRGYLELHPLPQSELSLLKLCIAARLCQSLVLGAYSAERYPDNKDYVLTTSATGWTVLDSVMNLPDSWPLDP